MTAKIQRNTVEKGDIVTHKGKPVLVQSIIDYSPELRKSFIKGCAIDKTGRPLKGADIFPGYDWEILK